MKGETGMDEVIKKKNFGQILCEYCLWEGKLELQENTMRYRHGQLCKCRERTVLETGPGFRLEWQENLYSC